MLGNEYMGQSNYYFRKISRVWHSIFLFVDAQTIRMCELEERHGQKGAYGRQIIYKTLAQVETSRKIDRKIICYTDYI